MERQRPSRIPSATTGSPHHGPPIGYGYPPSASAPHSHGPSHHPQPVLQHAPPPPSAHAPPVPPRSSVVPPHANGIPQPAPLHPGRHPPPLGSGPPHGPPPSGPPQHPPNGPGPHVMSGPPPPGPHTLQMPPAGGPPPAQGGRNLLQPGLPLMSNQNAPAPPTGPPNGAPVQLGMVPLGPGGASASAAEAATVQQILAEGERSLKEEAGERKPVNPVLERLAKETEQTWLAAGKTAEMMGSSDRAALCYEKALKYNPYCVEALTQVAGIYRRKEEFKRAAEYFSRLLSIQDGSGEVWGALGHCFLMLDDLQKAYTSYQQALYHFPAPKSEPKLWYGIGILYDRYGSLEHAEEAFSSVIKMDPEFEKANEIYFRLGIIYKQQRKHELSLDCFRFILRNPPPPLTEIDIWFQVGHVYEQMGDCDQAKAAYERVLQDNPLHAKVLQQLGGLYCRPRASFYSPDMSVEILTKSLETDPHDPFSWYLLGRAYMTTHSYSRAYEAYQQAVYRDGKNPAFWCSIGVLYYAISQFHDSLDAYSRAIRINPYIAEVWYNLGALYESCNDQMTDAIDAYQRAAQLDRSNSLVQRRLQEIRRAQQTGQAPGPPPSPCDMSATSAWWGVTNQGASGPPEPSFGGPGSSSEDAAARLQPGSPMQNGGNAGPAGIARPPTPPHSLFPNGIRPASGTAARPGSSAGIFHYGPPPPGGDRRTSGGHGPLAPIEIDRSPRDGRGPSGVSLPTHGANLPHITQVYDGHPRGPSPAPPQQPGRTALRRSIVDDAPAPPPPPPPPRGSVYGESERGSYGAVPEPPHRPRPSHYAPPPAGQLAPQHRYTPGPHGEDPRAGERGRWHGPSPGPERSLGHPTAGPYPMPPRDQVSATGPPPPQHQSPYDPRQGPPAPPPQQRHASNELRGSGGPSWTAERSYPPHVPVDDQRPLSRGSVPLQTSHRPWELAHDDAARGPPSEHLSQASGSASRRTSEEQRHLLAARTGSPTPSAAASDLSTTGKPKKSRSRALKDDDYAPAGSSRKRKAPAKPADGAPKEKKERKKATASRPKPPKAVKAPDEAKPPYGAGAEALVEPSASGAYGHVESVPASGASAVPSRHVDEDYDDDDEGASALLTFASQSMPQPPRPPEPQQAQNGALASASHAGQSRLGTSGGVRSPSMQSASTTHPPSAGIPTPTDASLPQPEGSEPARTASLGLQDPPTALDGSRSPSHTVHSPAVETTGSSPRTALKASASEQSSLAIDGLRSRPPSPGTAAPKPSESDAATLRQAAEGNAADTMHVDHAEDGEVERDEMEED